MVHNNFICVVVNRRDECNFDISITRLISENVDEFTDSHWCLVYVSASQRSARSRRNRLTALQRSSVCVIAVSLFKYTSASSSAIFATIDSERSGASVTLGNESIADTSMGSVTPPIPAISVASTKRSGGLGKGGSVHVKMRGNEKPRGGVSSRSSSFMTSSSNPSNARGSTSSERWRSIGPAHASSG